MVINGVLHRLRAVFSWQINMRHLPRCMHPRISTSGAIHQSLQPAKLSNGLLQRLLHRVTILQPLPAIEVGAIILKRQLQAPKSGRYMHILLIHCPKLVYFWA